MPQNHQRQSKGLVSRRRGERGSYRVQVLGRSVYVRRGSHTSPNEILLPLSCQLISYLIPMNLNILFLEQQLRGTVEQIRDRADEELGIRGEDKLKSLAFVYFCVKTLLDLTPDEAFDSLVEGGQDFKIDAIDHSLDEGELVVSLFQGKYKRDLKGDSNFGENALQGMISAVKLLFDPYAPLFNVNLRLRARIEEIRSLIRDGYIPQIRAFACNNGLRWSSAVDDMLRASGLNEQVVWEHVNHDRLVQILQSKKAVSDTLRLTGKAVVEDMNYSRVLLGRMDVTEVAALLERHGERLLERNIRRYLGLSGNRVNEAIRSTLLHDSRNFYFYNNGLTFTCRKFAYNSLQQEHFSVQVEDLQLINGGQTCMTIFKCLSEAQKSLPFPKEDAFVLVRLYQLPIEEEEFVGKITYATNNQNPVELKDLRSNDEIQKRLELDISHLGFIYRRKRVDSSPRPTEITVGTAAEALLSTWKERPHQARFFTREHFGRLYSVIFSEDLTGSAVVLAVLLYRIAEAKRRRTLGPDEFQWVQYGSTFIAMRMGQYLLDGMECRPEELSHLNFQKGRKLVEENGEEYFERALQDVKDAASALYQDGKNISFQQLSATFRRGDLIEELKKKPLG